MSTKQKDLGLILKILSLIWPLGLLIFFIKKENESKASKQALNLALIGFGISLVLGIVASMF